MKPDREEVLRMAREAGFKELDGNLYAVEIGFLCQKNVVGLANQSVQRLVALAYEAGARAERENTELDAKRYKWLRDGTTGEGGEPSCWVDTGYSEGFPRLEGKELDDAIDAIRARTTP